MCAKDLGLLTACKPTKPCSNESIKGIWKMCQRSCGKCVNGAVALRAGAVIHVAVGTCSCSLQNTMIRHFCTATHLFSFFSTASGMLSLSNSSRLRMKLVSLRTRLACGSGQIDGVPLNKTSLLNRLSNTFAVPIIKRVCGLPLHHTVVRTCSRPPWHTRRRTLLPTSSLEHRKMSPLYPGRRHTH